MKATPDIIFQGGPLDSDRHPNHLQIFASNGTNERKPDQYVKTVTGSYIAELKDDKMTVYVWRGVK